MQQKQQQQQQGHAAGDMIRWGSEHMQDVAMGGSSGAGGELQSDGGGGLLPHSPSPLSSTLYDPYVPKAEYVGMEEDGKCDGSCS